MWTEDLSKNLKNAFYERKQEEGTESPNVQGVVLSGENGICDTL